MAIEEHQGIDHFMLGIKAGYSHFLASTDEQERVIKQIKKSLYEYTTVKGNKPFNEILEWGVDANNTPPIEGLSQLDDSSVNTIIIMKNLHWFFEKDSADYPILTQHILDKADSYRDPSSRRILIIVTSKTMSEALPDELKKHFFPVTFPLPDEKEIEKQLDVVVSAAKGNPKFKEPTKEDRKELVTAAKGMVAQEAENAFSYSLVKHGRLDIQEVIGAKPTPEIT